MPAASAIEPDLLWLVIAVLAALVLVAGVLWLRTRSRAAAMSASLAAASGQIGAMRREQSMGLLPRPDFDRKLEELVQHCDRSGTCVSVLFVDLDNFASVNDAFGLEVGDTVLQQFALRMHEATPHKSAATRIGADQVVLVLATELSSAREVAQMLVAQLERPFEANGRPLQLSASIGIAAYPVHGARSMLVAHASTAARAVKQAGGGAHAVYDPLFAEDLHERTQMLVELREALGRRQFELVYQPKIDAMSQQVTAAEALLRWRHPTLGVVSPSVFIPLAERHGLIGPIGDWVIEDACRQAGVWRRAGLRMRVAINLSPYQMRQDDLVDRLLAALARNELEAERFTVEITESLAMENTKTTQRAFERLRKAGLHVAIDDFGAGQTSIAYLRGLPASELKLDISLVRDLDTHAEARTIAEALIKLAHALGRRVVAEGVETAGQRDQLVLMGCDELQGFLFARPMSATALGIWAMDDRPNLSQRFRSSLFHETEQRP